MSDALDPALLDKFDAITPSLQPVGDADFEEKVLRSQDVVVVQFFARWCGPCHKAAKALETVADAGRTIFKLDCETATETAARFCIKSYPKIMMFQRGGLKGIYSGERSPEPIDAWIAERAGPLA